MGLQSSVIVGEMGTWIAGPADIEVGARWIQLCDHQTAKGCAGRGGSHRAGTPLPALVVERRRAEGAGSDSSTASP